MEKIYAFFAGPALIASVVIFVTGMIYHVVCYFRGLDWKLDRVAYKPELRVGLKGGFHSIFKWLVPFGTHGWREHFFMALCFFLFHAGVVLLPLFLLVHNDVLKEHLGFYLPSLPRPVSDVIAIVAILAGVGLCLRRFFLPQVRILTTWRDYALMLLALSPLITGMIHRYFGEHTDIWMIAHMFSGELLLVVAPFTRLSHMVRYFLSRWQIGADFSIKRGGKNRGIYFPW